MNVTTVPATEVVPFTAPVADTLVTTPVMKGARSIGVDVTGLPLLNGTVAEVGATVGGGGLTVTVTVAGAGEVPPGPVAVNWNDPVPMNPAVGVKVMVVGPVASAVPFTAPLGVTDVEDPEIDPDRSIAIAVLKAVVALAGETTGADVGDKVTV